MEVVRAANKERELRTILEAERIDPEGRMVFVDGKLVEDLEFMVPANARIVVLTPVSGGW